MSSRKHQDITKTCDSWANPITTVLQMTLFINTINFLYENKYCFSAPVFFISAVKRVLDVTLHVLHIRVGFFKRLLQDQVAHRAFKSISVLFLPVMRKTFLGTAFHLFSPIFPSRTSLVLFLFQQALPLELHILRLLSGCWLHTNSREKPVSDLR